MGETNYQGMKVTRLVTKLQLQIIFLVILLITALLFSLVTVTVMKLHFFDNDNEFYKYFYCYFAY